MYVLWGQMQPKSRLHSSEWESAKGRAADGPQVRRRSYQNLQNGRPAHETRMLADVDRARQATKQLEGDLSKEQQRRVRGEEAAAELLDAERQALRDAQQSAQQTERALRDQLAAQGIALAQAQSQGSALQQRLDNLQGQFDEEKRSHDGTRALLAGALAAVRKPRGVRKPSPGAGEA